MGTAVLMTEPEQTTALVPQPVFTPHICGQKRVKHNLSERLCQTMTGRYQRTGTETQILHL